MKRKIKATLVTIRINEDCWDLYKKGQIIKFVVFSKTFLTHINLMTDNYTGSHFPDYSVIEEEEISDDFLFRNTIQKSISNDLKHYFNIRF